MEARYCKRAIGKCVLSEGKKSSATSANQDGPYSLQGYLIGRLYTVRKVLADFAVWD